MTDLQSKLLDLLKEIDKICQENEICYYLIDGSLLGAIRHKGFIPWDDDADIAMTRDNWNKFVKCTEGKLPDDIVLDSQSSHNSLEASHTTNHYADTKSTQIYRFNVTGFKWTGVCIDIIIIDSLPDTEEAKQRYTEDLTAYADMVILPYQHSVRIGKSTNFAHNWNMSRILGREKILDKLSRDSFSHEEEDSQLYAQRFAACPHFWPKELFGKPKYVPFEDTMLPIPGRAEDCLCICYDDDWMYVPKGGVNKNQHTFCVYNPNIPAELVGNDFESRIDRKKLVKAYVKRKKIQVANTEDKFKSTMDSYLLVAEKMRLSYKIKLEQTNVEELLENHDYDALETFFDEYIHIQCRNHYIGSSAAEGWINWYRKKNPYLIDIGDEALYAVLELLMYRQKLSSVGKLLKARVSIERPMTEKLSDMNMFYTAIKRINSAFDCGENAGCRNMLDEFLPRYPENPFLWKADLKLKEREGLSPQNLIDQCDKGLVLFPDDAEINFLKASSYLKLGDIDTALELFGILVSHTNHGLVLLKMRECMEELIEQFPTERAYYELWLEIRRQMGEEELPDIDEFCPEIENDDIEDLVIEDEEISDQESSEDTLATDQTDDKAKNTEEPSFELTDIQTKRFELLSELKQICAENGIRYYLIGKGLLQAARKGKYFDKDGELAVAMTPANIRKFLQAVEKLNRSDRYVDSMLTNPEFIRFCVRYGNSDTLDMFANQCANPYAGIFITIEILRNCARNRLRDKLDQMLEKGWEIKNTMKESSARNWICYLSVSFLCVIMGRKRAGRWLFNRFCKGPRKKDTGKYYIKPFLKQRTYYDAFWFKYISNVKFEGVKFSTMKPYDIYLTSVFGAKWKKRKYPYTKPNAATRITDASISYGSFFDYLEQSGIDLKKMRRHKQTTSRRLAPAVTLGKETNGYWDIMCQCGERWRLLEKYAPMKLQILELFRSNNVKGVMSLLKDYLDTAVSYSKKGLGICFDRDIFEIMEYCLKVKGKAKQADTLRKVMKPQDWAPIHLPGVIEVKGMREATVHDIPAILLFLKRNVENCLYMYIDIAKYGLENPNMKIWLDHNKRGITLVVMKYHTSISAYTDVDDWDVEGVARLIEEEKVLSVNVPKYMSDKLYPLCQNHYSVTFGTVFKFTHFRDVEFDGAIEIPTSDDALEIAKLIAADDSIGALYEIQNLANQITERWETNMGRGFIIREGGKIVAHIGSYAEYDGLATTSGLIVHPDYRSSVYGSVLERHLLNELLNEGFVVYTFITKRLRYKLLAAMGNEVVGEYAKYVREENKSE